MVFDVEIMISLLSFRKVFFLLTVCVICVLSGCGLKGNFAPVYMKGHEYYSSSSASARSKSTQKSIGLSEYIGGVVQEEGLSTVTKQDATDSAKSLKGTKHFKIVTSPQKYTDTKKSKKSSTASNKIPDKSGASLNSHKDSVARKDIAKANKKTTETKSIASEASKKDTVLQKTNEKDTVLQKKNEVSSSSSERFVYPVLGKVIFAFGEDTSGICSEGIEFGVKPHENKVHASGSGKVVYVNESLKWYKKLVIIEHKDDFVTLYGYLGEIKVKVGDSVRQGEVIGYASPVEGNKKSEHLCFIVREHGKAKNPTEYVVKKW